MIKLNNLSIRIKLIASTALLIFLAFGFLSTYNFLVFKEKTLNRIEQRELPAYVDNTQQIIQNKLNKAVMVADVMSKSLLLQNWLKGNQNDTSDIKNFLKKLNSDYSVFPYLVSYKKLAGYTPKKVINFKKGDGSHLWFFKLKDKKIKNEFNIDEEDGSTFLWVNTKIFDDKKQFLGTISVGMNIEEVKDFVISRKFSKESSIMMIDKKGAIKIHEDTSLIAKNEDIIEGKTLQTSEKYEKIANRILKKSKVSFTYTDEKGKEKIIISRKIPEFDWRLIVEISKEEIVAPIRFLLFRNLLTGSIITVIIIILNILLTRKIIFRPLSLLIKVIENFSKGNLHTKFRINQKDEIGQLASAVEEMQEQISNIVNEITVSAEAITNASKEISYSSQQLASGASEQAASIEEVSSSMEEMVSNIEQNSNNAQETGKIADASSEKIADVNSSVLNTAKAMKSIVEKIAVVSEIAEKTDLLAINAAVEAARAGEYGKGFSVVASEVRKLAEHSQEAANLIDELSKSSVDIAENSGNLLENVIPKVKKTSILVQEISMASIEQRNGAQMVNKAILQLNDIAQQNAASAEELASNSEVFTDQAENLKKYISFFRLKPVEAADEISAVREEITRLNSLLGELNNKYGTKKDEKKITQIEKINISKLENKGIDIKMSSEDDDGYVSF